MNFITFIGEEGRLGVGNVGGGGMSICPINPFQREIYIMHVEGRQRGGERDREKEEEGCTE
jgi:hypothetical protein